MAEEERKRYCMLCQRLQSVEQFERTAKGGFARNCKLHGKKEKERKESRPWRQRFCLMCKEMRPVGDFEIRRGNRICKRHNPERKDGTFMVEGVAKTRFCTECRQDKPIEEFSTYRYGRQTRIKEKCKLHDERSSGLPAVKESVPLATLPITHPAMKNGSYRKLFKEQDGRCAICGQPETARDEIGQAVPLSLYGAVHYSGRVQGLVCKLCNMGLSMFRDSPALLAAAITFLTRKQPSVEGDIRVVRHD